MSQRIGFAIVGCFLAMASVARAQEVPWLFAGGTDVAAIVDVDGDGPDPTDDCYFKVTGIPGFTGTFTLSFVDAMGDSCNDDFPCTGTFELSAGVEASVEFDECEGPDVEGLVALFFRPGPPVPTNALLSPNTMEIPVGKGETIGGLLCDSNGPAVLANDFGMPVLFGLSFFPNGTNPNPTHLVIPMIGGLLLPSSSNDVYVPLVNRKATIASQAAPTTVAVEFDFGGLCDCSLGGVCPAAAPGAAPAPAMGTLGLGALAVLLLAVGALSMRRRIGFTLPLL